MTIRIEIFGENHTEIRESLAGLASFLLGGTAPAAVAAAPEPVAETPARRGRKKADAPTIDHDPNEGATTDVHTAANTTAVGVDAGDGATPSGDDAGVADGNENIAPASDEAPAEVDAVASSDLTIDDLRAYTISSYLNVVTDSLPKRKELYAALLAEFEIEPDDKGIRAITRLPAEKIGAFKAAVDAKIAEAMKG